ncbi:hypothetical protein GUJ93_ZPchr0003g16531 [Zizania palustris]|uniref:Uncharacterized protein n=1 Tax=Zizania palustris TaxID=103762 RepID=A0A8J5V5U0_ZIZPA|nr:hypothetical protein GUJ93_ZPchr0003g16531 [Zizania palustris]
MCLANRRLAAPHRRVPARLRARAGHPLGRAPLRARARPRACACASPAPRLAPNRASRRLGSQSLQPRATACRLACCAWPLAFHRSSSRVLSPRVLSRPHVPSLLTRMSLPTPSVQTRAPKYQPNLPTPPFNPQTTLECLPS